MKWIAGGRLFMAGLIYGALCRIFPKLDPDYPFGERWDAGER